MRLAARSAARTGEIGGEDWRDQRRGLESEAVRSWRGLESDLEQGGEGIDRE